MFVRRQWVCDVEGQGLSRRNHVASVPHFVLTSAISIERHPRVGYFVLLRSDNCYFWSSEVDCSHAALGSRFPLPKQKRAHNAAYTLNCTM